MMRLVFFCCIVASFHALSAQKPAEIRRNAEKAFSEQQWRAAQQGFAQYQQIKPGDADVLTKLGIAHYQLKEGDLARKYLEYVATQTPNPDACYYYARTLHGLGDWEKAITAYKNYLRKAGDRHPFRANAADNIRRCMSGQQALANTNVALVENLGDRINSEGDEFAPLPSLNHADRLYFSAARAGSIGDRRNLQGLEDLKNGQYCSDMLRATRKTSGWEKTGTLGTLLNTSRHEVALGFNASGDILYFFRGFSTYSGQVFADTADRKDEYAISPPPFSSPMKPEEGDVSVYFFNDSVLLFASRRAGGFGGLDLWIAQKADSTWGDPLNLGASINSPYDETTPFLSADGRSLWFSSNRISSMGGLDVFKAVFDDKKRAWNAPQNAGTQINSSGDEAFFKLSPDGQSAFFSSDRLRDNLGQRDIFVAYFTENLAEQSSKSSPLYRRITTKSRGPGSGETHRQAAIVVVRERSRLSQRRKRCRAGRHGRCGPPVDGYAPAHYSTQPGDGFGQI
jgi:tetratricopeptide (TPR) repeat protein